MKEDGVQTPTGEMKMLTFGTKKERHAALCVMASNLFALHYVIWSSCQVVKLSGPDVSGQYPWPHAGVWLVISQLCATTD